MALMSCSLIHTKTPPPPPPTATIANTTAAARGIVNMYDVPHDKNIIVVYVTFQTHTMSRSYESWNNTNANMPMPIHKSLTNASCL